MRARHFVHGCLTCLIVFGAGESHAGAYTFAGESNGINVVTHAKGYSGTGGSINVKVCIVPGTPNAASMVIPLSNSVDRFNLLVPTIGNLRQFGDNDIDFSAYDFESVLTHELGHCQGLAHVNLATESGLSGNDRNFTKATDGSDNTFTVDDGVDDIIGSADDVRGDDVNLHWFFIGGNNPFVFPATPESSNYSRDVSDLPAGDNWVTNADRDVSTTVFGLPATESVMQQGTFNDEDQRALAADDVATLQHARTGLDRQAGTADDYTVTLIDGGISSTDCDINVSFDDTETGFAVCKSGGVFVSGDVAITTANSFYNTTAVTWHFGTRYIPLPTADNISVANGGSTSSLDGGGSSLLANDTDQQGDGLLLSSGTYFGPESGAVTMNANGTFTYTHDGSATTSDRFVYRVCSDNGSGAESNACAHQYVFVTVAASGNTPPTAVDDAIDTTRGGTTTTLTGGGTSLLANDSDPDTDGLSLSTTPVSGPTNGSVTLFSNGTFSYTHDNSLTASDTFDYQVCDDGTPSECSTATVAVTVDLGDVACSAPGVSIPDGDADGVTDTITITDTEVLSDLNVTLNISQSYVGDLSASLTHAATGTEVDLLDRPGVPASTFGCSNDNVDAVFDDEGAAAAEDACEASDPAIGGTLTPAGTLSDFDGESFAGDWTLTVTDSVTPDVGTLNSWCLDPATSGNAPVALSDGPGGVYVVDEGQGVTLSAAQLKSNDTDAEDGTPAGNVSLDGTDVNGAVVDNGNQTFTFTHDGGETSSASFQYRVADSDGLTSNLASVNLNVNADNDAPIANADGPGGAFEVDEGAGVTLTAAQLTANDTDEEDGTPGGAVSLIAGTTNGSVVNNGNQTFTFTHDGSETASATFQYQVSDSDGEASNTATVTLNVQAQNDTPVAANDGPGGGFTINEGQALTLSRSDLTGNDTDAEDGVPSGSLSLVGSTTNGGVADNGNGTYTFTHDGSETLSASFQYEVDDAAGATSNAATVSLTVAPQNDAPVANDDGPGGAFAVTEGDAVTLSASALTANDTDEEDTIPAGSVALAGSTTNGSVQDNGNQTFTFTHDGSETGSAGFQYVVLDSDGSSSATGTVNLQVNASNDSPMAADDGPGGVFSVAEDGSVILSAASLTGNDTDAEDGTPGGTVSLTGSSVNGAAVDNGNQTFTFTHDGTQSVSASFQYQVTDSDGQASNTATVNLSVNLSDNSPVANDDGPGGAFAVNEGGTVVVSASQLAANDTDSEDGQPGGDVSVVGSATNGSVLDNGDQTFTFTHDGSETATATFSYQIEDSVGQSSNSATVTLTVNPENDAPAAGDDGPGGLFAVIEGQSVTLSASDLVANDSDPEDGTPSGPVALVGGATFGGVVDNLDQTFTFTHDGSESGDNGTFQYQVADADGILSNVATVRLAVVPDNDAPVAADDGPGGAFVVNAGATVTIEASALTSNDTDSEDGIPAGAVTLNGISENGSIFDNGDQTFDFTHDGSATSSALFQYEVADSEGVVSNLATVRLTVTSAQDGPTAVDDAVVTASGAPVAIAVMANDRPGDNPLDPNSVVVTRSALNGEIDLTDGTPTYMPDPGFSGVDEFDYNIADTGAAVSNDATAFILVGELVLPAPCGPGGQRVRAFQNVFLETAGMFGAGAHSFDAVGLPDSLGIDASTGVIAGVPTPDEVSDVPYSISVSAMGAGAADALSFDLTVDADEDVLLFDSYELSCFAPVP